MKSHAHLQVADIADVVRQRADALMLSGESAAGAYPEKAIGVLRAVATVGADRVLFASDCPFDPEKGPGYIRDTIKIIEELDLTETERDKICFKNAQSLLGIA